MPSVLAYQNRLHATANQALEFTDVGATFDAATPLTNLGTMQLPRVATFTGSSCELDIQATDGGSPAAGESFSADVFGVMGIENLADGATIEFFDADSSPATSLGSVTWTPVAGQRHALLLLDDPITITTLRVEITDGGSGTTRIGALWAGPSVRSAIRQGYGVNTSDTGVISTSQGGTAWSFGGDTVHSWPAQFRVTSSSDLFTFYDALRTCGTTAPVLWIPNTASGWIERLALYGLVEEGWRTQNVEADIHDVLFSIRESV